MATLQSLMNGIQLPENALQLSGTVTITGIDPANNRITVTASGSDIEMENPVDGVNQIGIQPVMQDPGAVIYNLQFEIDPSLQGQWTFNTPAAQFFVNAVPAGVLFNSADGTSFTVPLYANLPEGDLARYKIGLGFLQTGSSTPLWIDDPTVILKPPTDGGV